MGESRNRRTHDVQVRRRHQLQGRRLFRQSLRFELTLFKRNLVVCEVKVKGQGRRSGSDWEAGSAGLAGQAGLGCP